MVCNPSLLLCFLTYLSLTATVGSGLLHMPVMPCRLSLVTYRSPLR